jgi:hypothetical protein
MKLDFISAKYILPAGGFTVTSSEMDVHVILTEAVNDKAVSVDPRQLTGRC